MSHIGELLILQDQDLTDDVSQYPGFIPLEQVEWAAFFGDVGSTIGQTVGDDIKTVIALSVPTRQYCSALIAAGLLAELATGFKPGRITESAHFKMLWDLEVDTRLTVADPPGPPILGIKEGEDEWNGEMLIKVRLKSVGKGSNPATNYAGDLRLMNPAECYRKVTVADDQDGEIHIHENTEAIRSNHQLASRLLNKYPNIHKFYEYSSLECLIIGNLSVLKDEIFASSFNDRGTVRRTFNRSNSTNRNSSRRGLSMARSLQDILQVKRFSKINVPYKTDVLGSQTTTRNFSVGDQPGTVVFDGSMAFNRWHSYYPSSNWIVVLDRTDANSDRYDLAIAGLLDERIDNGSPHPESFLGCDVPSGIDAMSYSRKIR